jgi:pimeloyl-ACP methyl ester carboxylesterase
MSSWDPPAASRSCCCTAWPYDIYSFAEAAPMLAEAGYRVIVPHLRGHGSTRFLSAATFLFPDVKGL